MNIDCSINGGFSKSFSFFFLSHLISSQPLINQLLLNIHSFTQIILLLRLKMFKRSFMKAYQIRKYGKPGMQYGILSSNYAFVSRSEIMITRISIYLATIFLTFQATTDSSIFYEIVWHTPPVYNATLYENAVPNEVRIPNEEVMEKFKKINEAKQLLKTFQIE